MKDWRLIDIVEEKELYRHNQQKVLKSTDSMYKTYVIIVNFC